MKNSSLVRHASRVVCLVLALMMLSISGEVRAEPQTNKWSALGSGVDKAVNAVAVRGSDVFVGGGFHTAGGIPARFIAKWNSTTGTWSGLGTTLNSAVETLVVKGKNVYVGGWFSDGIKIYNTAKNKWTRVGHGVNGAVTAIAFDGDDLYAAGLFDTAYNKDGTPVAVNNIAKYSNGTWSALGSGVTGPDSNHKYVWTLAIRNHVVYAGGEFADAGGVAHTAGLGSWDGAHWSALGTGVDGPVYALLVDDDALAVGGSFQHAGAVTLEDCCLAAWDIGTQTWSNMGHGVADGTYKVDGVARSFVWAIRRVGNEMYIAGSFTKVNGQPAKNIAKSNITTHVWSALGGTLNKNAVWAMAATANEHILYVGGEFTKAGAKTVNHIAGWNTH